jgi:hypothetical protein
MVSGSLTESHVVDVDNAGVIQSWRSRGCASVHIDRGMAIIIWLSLVRASVAGKLEQSKAGHKKEAMLRPRAGAMATRCWLLGGDFVGGNVLTLIAAGMLAGTRLCLKQCIAELGRWPCLEKHEVEKEVSVVVAALQAASGDSHYVWYVPFFFCSWHVGKEEDFSPHVCGAATTQSDQRCILANPTKKPVTSANIRQLPHALTPWDLLFFSVGLNSKLYKPAHAQSDGACNG